MSLITRQATTIDISAVAQMFDPKNRSYPVAVSASGGLNGLNMGAILSLT